MEGDIYCLTSRIFISSWITSHKLHLPWSDDITKSHWETITQISEVLILVSPYSLTKHGQKQDAKIQLNSHQYWRHQAHCISLAKFLLYTLGCHLPFSPHHHHFLASSSRIPKKSDLLQPSGCKLGIPLSSLSAWRVSAHPLASYC